MVMYCVQSFFSDLKSCVGWRMLWLPADKIIFLSIKQAFHALVCLSFLYQKKKKKQHQKQTKTTNKESVVWEWSL